MNRLIKAVEGMLRIEKLWMYEGHVAPEHEGEAEALSFAYHEMAEGLKEAKAAHQQYSEWLEGEIKECAKLKRRYGEFEFFSDSITYQIAAFQSALAEFNELMGGE